jgi:hypothetical protein
MTRPHWLWNKLRSVGASVMSDRYDGQIPAFSILGTLGAHRKTGLLMRQYIFIGKGDEVPTFSFLVSLYIARSVGFTIWLLTPNTTGR